MKRVLVLLLGLGPSVGDFHEAAAKNTGGRQATSDRVDLVFESNPQGAQVYAVGLPFEERRKALLGRTPFQTSLVTSRRPVTFEFRAAGHEPVTRRVDLRRAGPMQVRARMTATRPAK